MQDHGRRQWRKCGEIRAYPSLSQFGSQKQKQKMSLFMKNFKYTPFLLLFGYLIPSSNKVVGGLLLCQVPTMWNTCKFDFRWLKNGLDCLSDRHRFGHAFLKGYLNGLRWVHVVLRFSKKWVERMQYNVNISIATKVFGHCFHRNWSVSSLFRWEIIAESLLEPEFHTTTVG